MSTPLKAKAERVCVAWAAGDVADWLRAHGGLLFDTWSQAKLVRWVQHHAQRGRLVVIHRPDDWAILGVATWQRLPDAVPVEEAMDAAWGESDAMGARVYVSAMVGPAVPLRIWARVFHDAGVAVGRTLVVCHRRNVVRDLSHLFRRFLPWDY